MNVGRRWAGRPSVPLNPVSHVTPRDITSADVSPEGCPSRCPWLLSYTGQTLTSCRLSPFNLVHFHVHLFSVHLDIRHGWCWYVSPFATNGDLLMQFVLTGWLFLFAVLMAAGLLFTMVFFVCTLFSSPTRCSSEYLGNPRRSSCSPTSNAITLIP